MPQLATRSFLALVVAATAACSTVGVAPGGGETPLVSSLQVETFADSVSLVLQVTNAADSPVRLAFPSGQSFDFVISQDGREAWRWSAGQVFTQAVRTEMLAPGETRAFAATWQRPDVRGDLLAHGFLTARGRPVEQQARFRLP